MPAKTRNYGRTRRLAKGWTPERCAAYAARIRLHAPWTRATGPRTAAGKARSSRNALKHGMRSAQGKALHRLLARQKRFVMAVRLALRLDRAARPSGLGNPVKRLLHLKRSFEIIVMKTDDHYVIKNGRYAINNAHFLRSHV